MFRRRKKVILGELAAEVLRERTGLDDPNKAVGKLIRLVQLAESESNDLSDRLHEMQVRVEAAQEDANRVDAEFRQIVGKIAEAIDLGEQQDRSLHGMLSRIGDLRRKAEIVDLFDRVRGGRFDPDKELLRRVACAVGTATVGTVDTVLKRVNALAGMPGQIRGLELERDRLRDRVEELDGFDEDGNDLVAELQELHRRNQTLARRVEELENSEAEVPDAR